MENSNTLIAGENKPQAKYNKNVSIIPMIRPIVGSATNPIDDRQQQSSKSSQQSYSCNHDSSSQSICCPHQILFNAFSNHIIPFPYCIYNNNNNSSNSVINNKNSKQLDRSNQSKPLSSAAKRRIRRKRNQMKRFEAILTATAAATAVSILSHQKHYQQPLHIHHNLTNNQRKISKNNGYPLNNNDDNKNISLSVSNKHLNNTNNNNTINHNDKQYSNNDPFYNCKNASSFKIKSCLRYVIFVSVSLKQVFL